MHVTMFIINYKNKAEDQKKNFSNLLQIVRIVKNYEQNVTNEKIKYSIITEKR